MKSIVVEHPGDHGTLTELPDPKPGNGELMVRVAVAAVNPVDWKVRDTSKRETPFTLGQDFAGTIVNVGAGVSNFHQGDRVAGIARRHGAYSDLTLIPANDATQPLALIPEGVSNTDAAALLTPGLIAQECVIRAQCKPGSTIAIVGVMGSVGHVAAQLAKQAGARVIGIGHSREAGEANDLGITDYIAYDMFTADQAPLEVKRRSVQGVDVVLDLVNHTDGAVTWAAALRDGGMLLSTVHAFDTKPTMPRNIRAENANLDDGGKANAQRLSDLLQLVSRGEIRVPLGKKYDFSSAVTALDDVKSGEAKGKVVIMIRD